MSQIVCVQPYLHEGDVHGVIYLVLLTEFHPCFGPHPDRILGFYTPSIKTY